jgi:hypothetical protein
MSDQTETEVYQVDSGKESFEFDPVGLDELESIGLTLSSVENTASPDSDYTYAFELRDTDFTFSYDDESLTYTPLVPAEVDFTGSFFFDVDTTKLDLDPQLELGDLVLRSGDTAEFFFEDTETTNLPVFSFEASGSPVVDLESQSWAIDDIDLVITEEFSDFLVDAGASKPIAGLKIAEARTDREFSPVVSETENQIDNLDTNGENMLSNEELLQNQSLGTQSEDILVGAGEDDFIVGLFGNDVIAGVSGNDLLVGAEGNDLLFGRDDDDFLDGGVGIDRVLGNAGNDTLLGAGEVDFVDGGDGRDDISGGDGDDVVDGGDGDDVVYGNNGQDTVLGRDGNDLLNGENEDDYVDGGSGTDIIGGNVGNDQVYGSEGNDLLFGATGNDLASGDTGDDTVSGGIGDDTVVGGGLLQSGNDIVLGDEGNDLLLGEGDNDTLDGGEGNDRLIGINPNTPEFGEFGKEELDTLTGGQGNDIFALGGLLQADNSANVFYNDGDPSTTEDQGYALITDFDFSGADKIELVGSLDSYSLGASPVNSSPGTGIFFEQELIGIVENASLSELNIADSSQFTFVG